MITYGRVVGLLTLTGFLGLLLGVCGAAPRPEPLRGDSPCLELPAGPELPDTPDLRSVPLAEPLTWEDNGKPAKATKVGSKALRREALIAEMLPFLEKTRSGPAFMATLEALIVLEAPAEKVLPICLRALEKIDTFKPMPLEKDVQQAMLLEGIGDGMRMMLEKHIKVVKGSAPAVGVQSMPAPPQMPYPPQCVPPAHPFSVQEYGSPKCFQLPPGVPVFGGVVGGPFPGPGSTPTLPEPVPTHWRKPVLAEPVPVSQPMPLPTEQKVTPTTSNRPVEKPGTDTGLIPVSTLPPITPRTLERLATPIEPGRLVPVPMALPAPRTVEPCQPDSR